MTDRALNYLGLMRKAGRIEIGETATGAAVKAGRARLVVVAADASPNARRRVESFLQGRRALCATLPYTKEQLSDALGKSGFRSVLRSHQNAAGLFLPGQKRKRKRARNSLEPPVKRKLRGKEPALQGFGRKSPRGREQTESQRQIVGRALLAPVRRSEIDGDAPRRKSKTGILQSLEHTFILGCRSSPVQIGRQQFGRYVVVIGRFFFHTFLLR